MIKFWILQVLLAIDQLANALLLGYADESLSSRAYRAHTNNKIFGKIFRPSIDFLAQIFGSKNHCYTAYMAERSDTQLPPEFREETHV